jgi:hypothetical protein
MDGQTDSKDTAWTVLLLTNTVNRYQLSFVWRLRTTVTTISRRRRISGDETVSEKGIRN